MRKRNLSIVLLLILLTIAPRFGEGSNESLFARLIKPLVEHSQKVRVGNPEFFQSADVDLNANRVNFLLFAFGETYEPPMVIEPNNFIGSPTIFSLNLSDNTLAIITITHDVRAPEVERTLGISGKKGLVARLDHAYFAPRVGGIPLLKTVIVNATGLWPDYTIALSDLVIADLVRQVFDNKLIVEVPIGFTAHQVYLYGKLEPERIFPKGMVAMTGVEVVQYIKSVPKYEGAYPTELEHNVRKEYAIAAIKRSVENDPLKLIGVLSFFKGSLDNRNIVLDFDPVQLGINSAGPEIAIDMARGVFERKPLGLPVTTLEKYIVDFGLDPDHDRAIRWVVRGADKYIDNDFQSGVYQTGLGIEVPFNANPYGDLIREYWPSLRQVIRYRLLKQ